MVEISMMREPAVFWTNLVALITGFAMFGCFLIVPTLVQLPAGLPDAVASQVDFGFGASVTVAGLYLLPSSIVMLVVGPAAGMLERRVGARTLMLVGLSVLALGALALATLHGTALGIVIAMALVGTGVGTTYAMLAKLIIDAVTPQVTGVAMGMNTVMRTVGGVVGGQVGAAVLSSVTIGVTGVPSEAAFTTVFLLSAAAAAIAAVGTLRIPRRPSPAPAGAADTAHPSGAVSMAETA
jgi:MFS family permease